MKKLILPILMLLLTACAGRNPDDLHGLVIQINDSDVATIETYAEPNGEEMLKNQEFDNTRKRVWFMAIGVDALEAPATILRRQHAYEGQYDDEGDPYTGKVTKRKDCYVRTKGLKVITKSAKNPPNWAQCRDENNKNPTTTRSLRTWQYCPEQGLLWELTIDPIKDSENYSFACLH